MTYEHKGVKISLLEGSGEFHATIGGKEIVKPSLAAIKKVIDTGVKDKMAFEPPITMLCLQPPRAYDRASKRLENSQRPVEDYRVSVKRLQKQRSRWTSQPFAFETDRSDARFDLIEDTPENYAKIIAYWKAHEAEVARHLAAEQELSKLLGAIPMKNATAVARERGVA